MPSRSFGIVTKITVEQHSEVLQSEVSKSASDADVDELGEPIMGADPETTIVDEILIAYDFGNDVRPEASPMQPSQVPLIVDIDDGRPDPPRRLGALKRVDTSVRSLVKFNRHTGVWE